MAEPHTSHGSIILLLVLLDISPKIHAATLLFPRGGAE